jgi:hypothetical protein
MGTSRKTFFVEHMNIRKAFTRYSVVLAINLLPLLLIFGEIRAQAEWPHVVHSKDGTPISYEIYGDGEPTLIFVHGWSCDARYWLPSCNISQKAIV